MIKDINIIYREKVLEYEALLSGLKRKLLIISLLRLIVFVAGIFMVVRAFTFSASAGAAVTLTFVALFLLLVRQFISLSERIRFTGNLVKINRSELNALAGDFSSFDGGNKWKDRNHDFSDDIDLFGEDSLFRYLNRTVTGYGKEILAGWLEEPFNYKSEIRKRQEAVNELAEQLTWRQEFMAHGLGMPLEKHDIESLDEWMNSKEKFLTRHFLKYIVTIFPLITAISLVTSLIGLIPAGIVVFMFLLNLLLTGIYFRNINRIHSMVSKKYIFLSLTEKLILTFGSRKFSSEILSDISAKLVTGGISAANRIKELGRIIQSLDSRLNIFAGFILNGLVLWDFQCLFRLEKWKNEEKSRLPLWLETIGEADALISLSNHVFNNPEFVFPSISENDTVIDTAGMGHPLIPPQKRICNDFLIKENTSCIVTGANMSGKSTFLRTVAANLILGMAGTKVCAAKFTFKPVLLFSGMRTTDSLSSNESYFYAEIKRLRILKERLEDSSYLFFILDEILKGTNSEDKSTGSKMFLDKLLERSGTGIIATHDVSLGEMERIYPENIFNKCFEVEINGESVMFDYKLRDGITKKMNAAILMKQMGII